MSTCNRSFWTNRKIFVTGHTGFKGSWLSLWLDLLGAKVTGYALDPPTRPNLFEQARVAEGMQSIIGDIRDFSRLKFAVAESRPEVVIHLAAQSVVRRSYEDPIETYSSNVMGTVNLLEALRQINEPCVIVVVTSDKCYENREWDWGYRESDALGGHDPYSNSKACTELVASAFRDSYFSAAKEQAVPVKLATARAGNVIGGGDWTRDQLVPDLMRAFVSRQACLIRNPHSIRPWQFVMEPLRGYLMLAKRLYQQHESFASAWNFGPAHSDEKPVSYIANQLAELWGEGASWREDEADHRREAHFLKLDFSKTHARLGWESSIPLDKALEWTAEWYRSSANGADIRQLTRAQIERYETLLKE
jgi:CDP-glucose 4,6-dehydratase